MLERGMRYIDEFAGPEATPRKDGGRSVERA